MPAKPDSIVARPIICFSTGDQVDDVMRPTWRLPPKTGTGDARRGRHGQRRQADGVIERFDVRPLDREADDAPRDAGVPLRRERAPADERDLSKSTSRSSPISYGV